MSRTLSRKTCIERLIRDHGRDAVGYAYHLTRKQDDARDLVQEALFRTLRGIRPHQLQQPLKRWLFAVIRNYFVDCTRNPDSAYISMHRRSPNGPRYEDILVGGDDCPLDQLIRMETIELTKAALGEMKNNDRQVLMLRDMNGMRYQEVARALSLPLGTVRSRIHRARIALRQKVAALEG